MELEITWGRAVRVWWAYVRRNLIALVVAIILGGVLGFIVGFVGAAIGIPTLIHRSFAALLCCSVGFAISIVPVKMILGKTYGDFRLVLLSAVSESPRNTHSQISN
jgi:hypothetical protein